MTKSEQIINALADDLRPEIAKIEARPPTTRGHYAVYLGLLSRYTDDRGQAQALSQALIAAGANERGVGDAMAICYP